MESYTQRLGMEVSETLRVEGLLDETDSRAVQTWSACGQLLALDENWNKVHSSNSLSLLCYRYSWASVELKRCID